MMLRIATFNLENLQDKTNDPKVVPLEERIAVLRPQIQRLDAHIICFQEVIGQKIDDSHNDLRALKELLKDTPFKEVDFSNKTMVSTTKKNGQVTLDQNMVTVVRPGFKMEIEKKGQYINKWIPEMQYRIITTDEKGKKVEEVKPVIWDRPILHALVTIKDVFTIHIINLHLKSRQPVDIAGQKIKLPGKNYEVWKTSIGWAEGYFISSMKRVGQALETRKLIDTILDEAQDDVKKANILVCGDLNSDPGEVPIEAMCGSIENTGNYTLNSKEMISCEKTIPETSRYTYLHFGRKELLDHMLISKAMIPYYRYSAVYNETLHDESVGFATEQKFPESDHAPFVAEFEIPDL